MLLPPVNHLLSVPFNTCNVSCSFLH
jgi:splicing factor 3B subunit 2